LVLHWTYAAERFDRSTVEAVAATFTRVLRDLIALCARDERRYTPSDFPDANLDQATLDALIGDVLREPEAT
jgi:non-ribosomal peptide synthase protein (TIGR01720 family)